MSRRFRLQTLERLRTMTLDHAAENLARARRALADAEAEVALLTEQALACVTPARTTSQQVTLVGTRREVLREKAHQAADVVAERQRQVGDAVQAWHSARADLKAVEALHERHRIALAEADFRREQKLVDDLASIAAGFRGDPQDHDRTPRPDGEVA